MQKCSDHKKNATSKKIGIFGVKRPCLSCLHFDRNKINCAALNVPKHNGCHLNHKIVRSTKLPFSHFRSKLIKYTCKIWLILKKQVLVTRRTTAGTWFTWQTLHTFFVRNEDKMIVVNPSFFLVWNFIVQE